MTSNLPFSGSLGGPPPLRTVVKASLFLDLDGTIAPIKQKPSDVGADENRNVLLATLAERLDGRLAIVSGRTISELDRILSGQVGPLAGVHGLQRRSAAGDRIDTAVHSGIAVARATLKDVLRKHRGVILEDKGCSLALHYRCAPDAEKLVKSLALSLAEETGLILQQGAMVVELRTPGPNKADAIDSFLGESPFSDSAPIFIGDDLTDECGFDLVRKRGGMGIIVAANRLTNAEYKLEDVDAVFRWLQGAD